MPAWEFRQYLTEDRPCRCPILDWYGTLGDDIRAIFDLLVKELAETEDWNEPKPRKRKHKVLIGRHAGLCELKFKVGRRRFRPIGIWLQESRTFVFLGGCEKIGRDLTVPEDAFDEALKLKQAYDLGRGDTREHF
jgi:hypothetical protein